MKKRFLTILLFLVAALLPSACTNSSRAYAPSNINNYVIGFNTDQAAKGDEIFLKTKVHYVIDNEGNYTLLVHGKVFEKGEYSYRRITPNTATILLSYSDNSGLSNYAILLIFTSPTVGKWEGSYQRDKISTEYGSFEIVRHGF